ncbi:MAG: thioredoxin family protein [Armatimonadetes bacterium]|nr:thioredoxin family protein [Armatimonadota bacterium]
MKTSQTIALVAVVVAIAAIILAKAGSNSPEQGNVNQVAVPAPPADMAPAETAAPAPAAPGADAGATSDEESTGALPALLELGSVGCKPCEYMAPIIDSLTEELKGKVDVTFTDVAKEPDVARKYKIITIPTQVFLDADGKELFRHIGVFEKEEILAKLKELGMLKE